MLSGPVGGHASVQAWRSLSYQATPAGPARPAGGKTLNKPHSRAGTVMENQPARLHQHDTEPLWAAAGSEHCVGEEAPELGDTVDDVGETEPDEDADDCHD